MRFRARAQRRAFDRQLRRLSKFGVGGACESATCVLRDRDLADLVYVASLERFVEQGGAVVVDPASIPRRARRPWKLDSRPFAREWPIDWPLSYQD